MYFVIFICNGERTCFCYIWTESKETRDDQNLSFCSRLLYNKVYFASYKRSTRHTISRLLRVIVHEGNAQPERLPKQLVPHEKNSKLLTAFKASTNTGKVGVIQTGL